MSIPSRKHSKSREFARIPDSIDDAGYHRNATSGFKKAKLPVRYISMEFLHTQARPVLMNVANRIANEIGIMTPKSIKIWATPKIRAWCVQKISGLNSIKI